MLKKNHKEKTFTVFIEKKICVKWIRAVQMRVVCSRVSRPHIRDDKAGLRREQAPQVPTSCGEGQSERGGAPTLLRQCGDSPAVTQPPGREKQSSGPRPVSPRAWPFTPISSSSFSFQGPLPGPGPPEHLVMEYLKNCFKKNSPRYHLRGPRNTHTPGVLVVCAAGVE